MKTGRILPQLALLTVLSVALGFVALQVSDQPTTVQAVGGASLTLPEANCAPTANASATVNFKWGSVVGKEQWLDIGTSESFAPGTFRGVGPLDMGLTSQTLQNLPARSVHYWRINTLSESGWETSDTGVFVPCGAPALLWGPLACESKFRAKVSFRWAPSADKIAVQYLDLGFDPGFAPGSFVASPPRTPSTNNYTWSSIYANVGTVFRVNALGADGVWRSSETAGFYADCAPPVREGIIPSADRLTIPRLGVDAPVGIRDVAFDGHLGDPAGAEDVVRYTWPVFDGFGGYPGDGGTTLIAGHVDYYYVGAAIFAPLRDILEGDVATYHRADGVAVTYVVDWVTDLPNDYGFGELARSGSADTLILITCNGDFNYATGEYSHRRVVHLTRVQ